MTETTGTGGPTGAADAPLDRATVDSKIDELSAEVEELIARADSLMDEITDTGA